jgi:hypothetical protein
MVSLLREHYFNSFNFMYFVNETHFLKYFSKILNLYFIYFIINLKFL